MVRVLRPLGPPLLALTLVLVPFLLWGASLERWTSAAFAAPRQDAAAQALAVLLLASDVVLPVPSSLVSLAAGAIWGFGNGAALVFAGMSVGSCLGYALGRGWARGVRARRDDPGHDRIARWFEHRGDWVVVLSRPLPVLAEITTLYAGLARMPVGRFLALSILANAAVAVAYAAVGSWIGRSMPGIAVAALFVSLGAIALAMGRRGTEDSMRSGARDTDPRSSTRARVS